MEENNIFQLNITSAAGIFYIYMKISAVFEYNKIKLK